MKNRAASLRARLLNLAKKENIDFQLIITRFLHERLLYRLSLSDFSNQFILKGGSFIYAIQGIKTRPTLDIDLLGQQIPNDLETLCATFRAICRIESDDEVLFYPESVEGEIVTQQDNYNGVRLFLESKFGTIWQRLQIDIGFGDVITPASKELEYPVLLDDLQVPFIQAYSKETVIAEKFQAMIELSLANSRMKDFYDVYMLLLAEDIDSKVLRDAIIATFNNRQTYYTENHALFTAEFVTNTQRQRNWAAFLRKINKAQHFTFDVVMKLISGKLLSYWEEVRK